MTLKKKFKEQTKNLNAENMRDYFFLLQTYIMDILIHIPPIQRPHYQNNFPKIVFGFLF